MTYRTITEGMVDWAVELFRLNTAWPCRMKEGQLAGSEGGQSICLMGQISGCMFLFLFYFGGGGKGGKCIMHHSALRRV